MRSDIIDIGEEDLRKKVEDILKNRSRDQRYHLHKHFQKFKTLKEAKQNKPARLTQENWDDFCAYLVKPQGLGVYHLNVQTQILHLPFGISYDFVPVQERCVKNKENRKKGITSHNQGSRAFVTLRNEIVRINFIIQYISFVQQLFLIDIINVEFERA